VLIPWLRTHSNSSSEAQESLAQLHETVEQILDTNHALSAQMQSLSAQIAESQTAMQMQLRELIAHRTPNDYPALESSTDHAPDSDLPTIAGQDTALQLSAPNDLGGPHSPDAILISPATTMLTARSGSDDAASIRTTATTMSIRSIRSVVPSIQEALQNSRVYKRLSRRGRDSDSVLSVESSGKGCTWSMLSDMSLGEMSISELSVLELPIFLSDLWDPEPFRVVSEVSSRGKTKRSKWSSRGRIHNAIDSGNDYVVRTLLALGSDIEERDADGRTPLAHAAMRGDLRITESLLEKGADVAVPDNGGLTPLAYAFVGGNEATITLLRQSGADFDARDSRGLALLAYAVLENRTKLVKLLLDCGADADVKAICELQDGKAIYELQGTTNEDTRDPIIKQLLQKGASFEVLTGLGSKTNVKGRLERAIVSGSENVVRLLLALGADLEERMTFDAYKMTPLLCAAFYGKLAIVKLLLEKGADVNARVEEGWTVLHCVAVSGDAGVLQILLDNGALHLIDVTATRGDPGDTPLHRAAEWNRLAVAQMLVESGAAVNPKNDSGATPYQRARAEGSMEVAKYLWSQLSPDEQAAETPPAT
jgi:ankyrin repeat protein